MPLTFDDLLDRARSLAGHLVRELNGTGESWVAHVPMDGFPLADVKLERLGLRDHKGAPATFDAAGYAALLRRLREDTDDVVYAPGFERDLERPIAGATPVLPTARLMVTEGNYLLLPDGLWARVRPALDEVWFCDIDEAERIRRLVARHEEFGKGHDQAVGWVAGTDQRNADLVAATRDRADLVAPEPALPAPYDAGSNR
ncbi:nucleoside/nucleotide kinase family protein [Streptomyces sp. NPDC048275]|uniref:nucleoside/nucleotide kinase family protein n=1 Tax=Streptomyces sp. NPDC048275 TaxID=3155629 RepID=UPI0033F20CCC